MDLFAAVAVLATDAAPDTLLLACTAALEQTSGLRTHVVTATDAIPPAARVLVVPGADRAVADELATRTGLPVVTTEDTTAIAIAAALSTTLVRAGRRPRSSHVVIAGARRLPLLFPLVLLAEVGQVTKWEVADAPVFPLHRIAADADVVIDLVAATGGGPAVITPDLDRDPLLALPGLVRALAKSPHQTPDIDVHQACALALVMATAPAETRPSRPDRALTDAVSAAAVAALRNAAAGSPPRSPGIKPDQAGS